MRHNGMYYHYTYNGQEFWLSRGSQPFNVNSVFGWCEDSTDAIASYANYWLGEAALEENLPFDLSQFPRLNTVLIVHLELALENMEYIVRTFSEYNGKYAVLTNGGTWHECADLFELHEYLVVQVG